MDIASLQSFIIIGDVAGLSSRGIVPGCFFRPPSHSVVLGLSWFDFTSATAKSQIRWKITRKASMNLSSTCL